MMGPKVIPTLVVPNCWTENSAERMPIVIEITAVREIPVNFSIPSTADITLMAGVRIPSAVINEKLTMTRAITTRRNHLARLMKSMNLVWGRVSRLATPNSDAFGSTACLMMAYSAKAPPSPLSLMPITIPT
ncbi:hypothetical protein ATCV1_z697L [Acanthocystis turfacea chlorella virus 1]|uniref:Uncharacterized protein z697L n=1 Tax=Chlorovirus heliozoae TaxID=322019 RepID=A7K9V7_9PHYC|nr:hypothetical protein ATCV1_z697L [Acanthocystis turfacea chlorella virus 1]ABT16831.1 hypothetical protein ATCV1_z697L [Acanthocystis turfacea chlorella virus 1]